MDSPRTPETSGVDRLAAIQSKHRRRETLDYFYCSCGNWRDDYNTHDRHVAEMIVAAEDLAVIELPATSERSESSVTYGNLHRVGAWPATADLRTGYVYFDEVESGDSRSLRSESAVKYATNILAAALAAKAATEVAPDE